LLIDTPGIRALEVLGADEGLEATFDDVSEIAAACRFNDCGHTNEPGCAVRAAVADGRLSEERVAGHQKLERELAQAARQTDPRAGVESRRKRRLIHEASDAQAARRERTEQ
jgi:ribosome biogenesis GTPase